MIIIEIFRRDHPLAVALFMMRIVCSRIAHYLGQKHLFSSASSSAILVHIHHALFKLSGRAEEECHFFWKFIEMDYYCFNS